MCIFKNITYRYCEKIFKEFIARTNKNRYFGEEAELVITRREYARHLIEKIQTIEVNESGYAEYFRHIANEIKLSTEGITNEVQEFNRTNNTDYTTDLFGSFLIPTLNKFMDVLHVFFQHTPVTINQHKHAISFNNNREVPWIFQFCYVLYEYILDKELDILFNQSTRDIFDTKKNLIIKNIQSAVDLYSCYKNESHEKYIELMMILLKGMRSEEQTIQQRKPNERSTNTLFSYATSYATKTLYKASETLIGKNLLSQKIDFLIEEFQQRAIIKGAMYGSGIGLI